MIDYPRFKAAAAHVAPVYLDVERTVDKACDVIAEAARSGVRLIAFPEAFIPGFPHWPRVVAPNESDALFADLAARALRVDGPEIRRVRMAALRHDMFVSIGFTEGTDVSVGCLWNSNVMIGNDGAILNHHRKLVPTFMEKLVWANGDGAGLKVNDTEIGRIGMLICGENANPLARYTLMAQGEQVHISSYPSISPARRAGALAYDIEDAIRIRAAAHAFEAKAYNIVSSAPFDATARKYMERLGPETLALFDSGSHTVSMIVDPTGKPVGEVRKEEGLCIAEIDLAQAVAWKRLHDVTGYYNRFDIFDLRVNTAPNKPIHMSTHRSAPDGTTETPAFFSAESLRSEGRPHSSAPQPSIRN